MGGDIDIWAIFDRLLQRRPGTVLSEPETTLELICEFIQHVHCDGHFFYFFNHGIDEAERAAEALDRVSGAEKFAQRLKGAIRLTKASGAPTDVDAYIAIEEHSPKSLKPFEDAMWPFDEQLYDEVGTLEPMLVRYVEENRAAFML